MTVSASVEVIKTEAFLNCARLKKITFVEGSLLHTLENGCFKNCGIEEFQAPKSLRQIKGNPFLSCKNLKRIELNKGLETFAEGCLQNYKHAGIFNDTMVQQVVLPATLKVLGYGTFYRCNLLWRITLQEGSKLESIGK